MKLLETTAWRRQARNLLAATLLPFSLVGSIDNDAPRDVSLHLIPVDYSDGEMFGGPVVDIIATEGGNTAISLSCAGLSPVEIFYQNVTSDEAWGYVPCNFVGTITIHENAAGKLVIN